MRFPTISALWFSAALWWLLYSLGGDAWFWSIVLTVLVAYGFADLVVAIRACEKRYRAITIAGCGNTFAFLWCIILAGVAYDTGHLWAAAFQAALGLLNGFLVIRNQMIIADSKETYLRIARWKAEHFTPEELELLGQSGGQ